MKYISTRNKSVQISGCEAIVQGISKDGGLFVPSEFPTLSDTLMYELMEMDYAERAAKILSLYLDQFSYDELLDITQKAYATFDGDPCPVVKIEDNLYIMELWHGPTCAFKDMALTVLPYLLTESKRKLGIVEETMILVATSGDTGKAALEGFKDVAGTKIVVFYPSDGVSDMQKLQMMTQEGNNVGVFGITGNFDDAQTAVKNIFTNPEIADELKKNGIALSSANSINWGRLAPQIAYYISSYIDLVNSDEIAYGDKINFCVPTGNFGNILAAYYATQMGLPIDKLIVASNQNNILTDFFNTGVYDTERDFFKSISPSMDILISSNLERLLFEIYKRDDNKINKLMQSLKETKKYQIPVEKFNGLDILCGYADEIDTKEMIDTFFDINDYLLDTHTAVAVSVYTDYVNETNDFTPSVIVSTANPYKFCCDVYNALGGFHETDAEKAMQKLENVSGMDAPESIKGLKLKERLHTQVVDVKDAYEAVKSFLKI